MSQNIDLKQADNKVFTASLNDGLLDIFLTSFVLMFVVALFLSRYLGDFWSAFIFLPFWGLVYLVLRWLRVHVVNPRIGTVKYGPIRRKKITAFTIVMLVLNILFLLLGIVAFIIPSVSGWRFILAFGAQVLILFSLGGYFLDLKRLYVYGLMLALAAPVGEWLYQTYKVPHHGYPVTYGLSALIIFLVGLAKFITLVRNNPLPPEDLSLLETNNG
jgi:hypothetical protein